MKAASLLGSSDAGSTGVFNQGTTTAAVAMYLGRGLARLLTSRCLPAAAMSRLLDGTLFMYLGLLLAAMLVHHSRGVRAVHRAWLMRGSSTLRWSEEEGQYHHTKGHQVLVDTSNVSTDVSHPLISMQVLECSTLQHPTGCYRVCL